MDNGIGYGLGWIVYDINDFRYVMHTGHLNGYSSYVSFIPEYNIGTVIFVNNHREPLTDHLAVAIYDYLIANGPYSEDDRIDLGTLLSALITDPYTIIPFEPVDLTNASFEGKYYHAAYGDIELYYYLNEPFALKYFGQEWKLTHVQDLMYDVTMPFAGSSLTTYLTLSKVGDYIEALDIALGTYENPSHFDLVAICGNDVQEGTEVCDGTDLAGETCQCQGFDDGTLACLEGCGSLDTSGCYYNSMDDTASVDLPISGIVSGSYVDTQGTDNGYESIKELVTGGKPSNRRSYLEHKWIIDVSVGSKSEVTFFVEAYHTANGENDDFIFAYSTDDSTYTDMVTVTKIIDNDEYQTFSLPTDLSGTVYIRVIDTDSTKGNTVKDTVYIDHMFIRSVFAPPSYGVNVVIDEASQTVQPGESTTYTVRIKNNGDYDASYSVSMSGTGVSEPNITVSPLNWNTGILTPGTQDVQTVTVSTTSSTPETTYSLTPTAVTDQDAGVADSTTSNLVVSSQTNVMHVDSIDMSLGTRNRGPHVFTHAIALITIVDASNSPVQGATVSGSWSDATSDADSGVTDSAGQVSLDSNEIKNAPPGTTFTFTVDNVALSGWTYDPVANVETSDSITI